MQQTGTSNKRLLFLVVISVLLSGCAHHYVVKLNNGSEIDAYGKPKLKGGAYYFNDGRGKQQVLPSSRVNEIEPASMAKDEQKAFTPSKPHKPRHWYFLWLAMNKTAGENEAG
jgi:hypothetical protein